VNTSGSSRAETVASSLTRDEYLIYDDLPAIVPRHVRPVEVEGWEEGGGHVEGVRGAALTFLVHRPFGGQRVLLGAIPHWPSHASRRACKFYASRGSSFAVHIILKFRRLKGYKLMLCC
jgi:hypothetical protein